MALILVGQNELWDDKLRLKRYAAVRQRIDINCVLPRLDRAETERYIQTHLAYAGCNQELFTPRAVDEIFRVSAGTMRMINRVCEKALMYGYQQNRRLLDDQDIVFISEHEMLEGGEI
jgi:type II secretory pathway predicted ATPase ExeA